MDDLVLAKIMALRGLGYTQAEVAGKLGLKLHQVQYALSEVNEDARKDGDMQVYARIVGAGFLPKIVEAAGKISD